MSEGQLALKYSKPAVDWGEYGLGGAGVVVLVGLAVMCRDTPDYVIAWVLMAGALASVIAWEAVREARAPYEVEVIKSKVIVRWRDREDRIEPGQIVIREHRALCSWTDEARLEFGGKKAMLIGGPATYRDVLDELLQRGARSERWSS